MTEEESLIAHFEKSRVEFEQRSKELIPVRMKIVLEGFVSDIDIFEVAPELIIRRAQIKEREAFYSRTPNPKDIEIKAKENEFFAEYDFEIHRGSIHGLAPVEGINLISIFFTVIGSHILNINKGNFYLTNDNEFQSAGFYTCPNEYRFVSKASHNHEDLEQLKTFWPLFKSQYLNNLNFALVARRYYYSILRLNDEDRLIDLMIALEALLVPETSGTKGDKISSRLASLISPKHEFNTVQNFTSKAYRLRNKIVHGGDIRKLLVGDTSINLVSDYCKTAIQEYLLKYPGLNSRKLARILSEHPSEFN